MAYLVYKANRVQLEQNSISIGRSKTSELVINETTVSRNHSIIKQIGDKFYIIDSGSSNGTFKDGKRVHSPVLLEHKSLIQCGNAQIVFYEDKIDDESDDTMISLDTNFIVNSIVVIADIRGYTAFSESVPIRKVSKFMANWFKDISSCIEDNNGCIDSFIGDCVYSRWDVSDDDKLASKILNTVLQMSNVTKKLSSAITDGEFVLDISAGIHLGEIIVGTQTNNTGLGDTVNTAFRLETQTRTLDTDILISNEVCKLFNIETKIDEVMLKGKSLPMKVCGIRFNEIDNFI
ncbi:MAG TPA: FHA domain-containing protein [Arcobacter sp.]|nr:FHA domain-containing protein [Arcobacter sp.]